MKIHDLARIHKLRTFILIILLSTVAFLFVGNQKAYANHFNWSVPPCPSSSTGLQTGFAAGFEIAGQRYYSSINYTVTQGTASVSPTFYGEGIICPNASYSSATNARFDFSAINSRISGLSNPLTIGDGTLGKTNADHTSDAFSVSLSGLGTGTHQFCFQGQGSATYPHLGGARRWADPFTRCVNVTITAPTPVYTGRCTVSVSDSTLTPGQSFTASFTVTNTGNQVWQVTAGAAGSYRMQSTDPVNTTKWGGPGNRLDIPGVLFGGGYYLPAGWTTPSPSTTPTTFTYTFTAPSTTGTHRFGWRVINGSGSAISGASCYRDVNVSSPSTVTLTCPGSVSPSITNPEPGEPFTIRTSFNVSGGNFSDPARDLRITSTGGLNISGALTKDYQPEPVPNGSSGYADFGPVTAPASGNYTVTYELTGGSIDNCQGQVAVRTKPYFRVYGGDVTAGLGFGSSCSVVADSKIIAFNKGSSGSYAGAGVQLADYALGKIDGFSSAATRTTAPIPANGLSFSNSNSSGEYGGNWKGGDCIPDFFAKAPSSISGPVVLPAQLIFPGPIASSKITKYIDGDVFIDGDITYADGFAGLYTTDTMPLFRLVVKGNIYVGANVNRLDGLYIVQPSNSPNSGKFYTCAFRSGNSFSLPTPTQQIDSVSGCGRKLTVYGAVLSQGIKLLRTNGTLRNSIANENYQAGSQAESFIYTPEVWLGQQGNHGGYDSYTGLPPIL